MTEEGLCSAVVVREGKHGYAKPRSGNSERRCIQGARRLRVDVAPSPIILRLGHIWSRGGFHSCGRVGTGGRFHLRCWLPIFVRHIMILARRQPTRRAGPETHYDRISRRCRTLAIHDGSGLGRDVVILSCRCSSQCIREIISDTSEPAHIRRTPLIPAAHRIGRLSCVKDGNAHL